MSQPPQTPSPAPATDAPAEAHLASLHKMSTTAGVTNLGYVAVNHAAVLAAFLGLASLLALFHPLLLIVPVAGVIIAIVALAQIRDSSGTQTGRPLAITGLVLAVLLGGGVATKEVLAIASLKGDENQIAATLRGIGLAIRDGKFDQAYANFDEAFQERVKLEQFKQAWDNVSRMLGPLETMEWNGVHPIFESSAGAQQAETRARVKFARSSEERFDVFLQKIGGKWRVTRFPTFFPEKRRNAANDFNL